MQNYYLTESYNVLIFVDIEVAVLSLFFLLLIYFYIFLNLENRFHEIIKYYRYGELIPIQIDRCFGVIQILLITVIVFIFFGYR